MVPLLALVWAFEAGAVERRAWYYEQLITAPEATVAPNLRHQFRFSAANFADAFSFQAFGLVDVGYVELKLQYSERLFAKVTPVGRELAPLLQNDRRALGFEVARYIVTSGRRFGRLGFEGFWLSPSNSFFAKIGMSGGVAPSAGEPWSIAINAAYLLSVPRRGNDALAIQLETRRRVSSLASGSLSLGGFLHWTYRLNDSLQAPPGDYEMMLFSFGPALTWGGLRVALAARLALDTRVTAPNVDAGNPSVLRLPDVSVTWGLPM